MIGICLSVAMAWCQALPAPSAAGAPPRSEPRTILFVGNSFTHGGLSPVRNWAAGSVTDLDGSGYGGVPALFKAFSEQAGLNYAVSLETRFGTSLGFHYDRQRHLFDRAWDTVVLQEYSTLDPKSPGDTSQYVRNVGRLGSLFRMKNAAAQIFLTATWSRADMTYLRKGPWTGKPITAMAQDLRAAADLAKSSNRSITAVLPVGEAWNRAFMEGVADPNPYDGIDFGKANLWTYDHYHGSAAGYYLEALVVFGRITKIDPRSLGMRERAGDQLGLGPKLVTALQRVAAEQLLAESIVFSK